MSKSVRLTAYIAFVIALVGLWTSIGMLAVGGGNATVSALMGLLVGVAGYVVGELEG